MTKVQAEAEKKIKIELILGNTYQAALGQQNTQRAKQLVEEVLAHTLNEKIKYFTFVPSNEMGSHTLVFRLDHPSSVNNGLGQSANLYDYYIFMDFNKDNSNVVKSLHWLYRDAASSLSGVDTPETIAEKISNDVRERQYENIIDMLSEVSFTSRAHFKPDGYPGWIIDYSRNSLCMAPDSKLAIETIVPSAGFEDKFNAEVKRRITGDDSSTYSKATEDVQPLMSDPDSARVIAIYVMKYEAECESTLTESSPSMVTFSGGDGP